MAEGFKIADGYIDVETRYDEAATRAAAEDAGKDAADGFARGHDGRLRDSRGRFVKSTEDVLGAGAPGAGDRAGGRWGRSLMRGLGRAVTGTAKALFTDKLTGALGGGLMSFVKSPVGMGALLALGASAGTMIASGLASTLAVAFGSGLGLGFIGLGAFLLRDEPAIIKGLERIKKSFDRVFGGAAKRHFLGPITEALRIINRLVRGLEKPINDIFKALAPAIVPLTRGLEGMIQNMMPGLTALMEVVGHTLGFEEPLMSLGAFLNDMFMALAENWPAIMASFFSFMEDLGAVLKVLGGIFLWLATNYDTAKNVFLSIVAVSQPAITAIAAVVGVVKYLADNVPRWLSMAGGAISGFFSAVGSTVSGWVTSTLGFFSRMGAAIASWVGSVVRWFSELPGRIASWLAQLPGVVARAFTDVMHKGLYLIGFMIGSWLRFYRDLPGNIASALSFLWGRMVGAWTTVRTNVTNMVRTTVDNVTRFFRELPGRVAGAVSSLWARMAGAFSSARSNASRGATNIVTGAVNILRSLPGKAASAISSVRSRIQGAFSGAGNWLVSAGRNIILGLARGLKGAIGAAVSAAKSAAGSILGGIRGAFGIGSPSKVAEKEVGRWIPPGITEGIRKQVPKEQAKLNALAPSVAAPAVQSAMAPAAGRSVTISNLNVNITGVLDPADPLALRRLAGRIHAAIAQYEREYA